MKITNVSYERLDLKLSEGYTIAYETITNSTNFILKLETDGKLCGYGCAAPDSVVTYESPELVESNLRDLIIPGLKGKNPLKFAKLLDDLSQLLGHKTSALAMVDMALMDLAAKKMEVPLYQFLGGYRNHIATSITIGICSVDETLKKARTYVDQGFFILKLKGGLDYLEDVEKLRLLREAFPEIILRFDGNQGFSLAQAIAFCKDTAAMGIEIFEQPTDKKIANELGKVRNKTEIPVMADESMSSSTDALKLARQGQIDMINIKLMKVGGIKQANNISAIAQAAGVKSMVGCLDECSLGIAAGLHFALSRKNVKYADLDGHLDLLNDPFKGLFEIKAGIMYPTTRPGLGVDDSW